MNTPLASLPYPLQRVAPALLLVAALAGCASEPTELSYREPALGTTSAVVVNQGSTGTQSASLNCQLPRATHVCRVWLAAVDGRTASFESRSTRLTPGPHDVRVGCNSWRGGFAVLGAISSSFTSLTGPFEAGQTYFVRCMREKDAGRGFIAATAEGPALPQFKSSADGP